MPFGVVPFKDLDLFSSFRFVNYLERNVSPLDPLGRASFFRELTNTAVQFGAKVDAGGDLAGDETNDDGSSDENEGEARGGRRGGRGFDPAAMFTRLDTDGDGKLKGDEFGGRMRRRMDQIDTDADGELTLEEVQAGMGGRRRGGREVNSAEEKPERAKRPE